MTSVFHREYLIQLPLPLAQLYNRAHNAKDPRHRHDNAYYLFETLVKLMTAPLVAAYLHEMRHGGTRVDVIDAQLQNLALPSLGHWVGMVRELAKHFGTRAETTRHPLAHLWGQLTRQHRDKPGLVGLYQRIKHGADGDRAGDRSCSILAVLEALVPYRNGVFGHAAGRFESFYAQDMGPLLFPALNEILTDAVLAPIGPPGSRLIYLHEVRAVSEETMEISFRDLVGYQGEWGAPMMVGREEAKDLIPHCVAVLWPEQRLPLRLDPLLRYRETDLYAEVLFLNRNRGAGQVEYLSYTTGRTERDTAMARSMARLLSLITDQTITEEQAGGVCSPESYGNTAGGDTRRNPLQPRCSSWGTMTCWRRLAAGAWAWCIWRGKSRWDGSSRSRCCPTPWRAITLPWHASSVRCVRWPVAITPTSLKSLPMGRCRMGGCTTPWSTCQGRIWSRSGAS